MIFFTESKSAARETKWPISSFMWSKKLSCGALSQQLPRWDMDCCKWESEMI